MLTYLCALGPAPEEGADRVELLGDIAVQATRRERHYLEAEIEREYREARA